MQPIHFVGRAPEQVTEFLRDCVQPILDANRDILGEGAALKV